jgi:hypothetical protein
MWLLRKIYAYDVFVSHAVEDKRTIADDLHARLIQKGIKVWYSGTELFSGGDISEEVRKGLYGARFGVVVFSPNFISSVWTNRELNWLEAQESTSNRKIILPALHNMTIEELGAIHPRIAQKFCIEAHKGMDYVVNKIAHEVEMYHNEVRNRRQRRLKYAAVWIVTLISLLSYIGFGFYNNRPTPQQVKAAIEERIHAFLNTVENRYATPLKTESFIVGEYEVDSIMRIYQNLRSYYRNEYEFNNGLGMIRGRRSVEAALMEDLVKLADQPGYGMDSVDIYLANTSPADGFRHSRFALLNKRPVAYTQEESKKGPLYIVKVNYSNEIRYIDVRLTYPTETNGTKRHEMTLLGFLPSEIFYFEEGSDGEWYFQKVE